MSQGTKETWVVVVVFAALAIMGFTDDVVYDIGMVCGIVALHKYQKAGPAEGGLE